MIIVLRCFLEKRLRSASLYKPALDSCIGAVVEERLVCHTVTYDLGRPSLNLRFSILVLPDDDGAFGRQRGILVEEVEGS